MLISIIVPTYNRVSLLIETVNSILAQTYEDFEIIVISDGSTDNTQKEISKIKDSRLKFIQLKKNYGYPAKARNEGIKISKGKFIAFCDDDDLWETDKLQRQVEKIEKGYNFIFTNYSILKSDKNPLKKLYHNFIISFLFNKLNKKISFLFLSFSNPIVNSSVLLEKRLIIKIMFNESIAFRASEDYQTWINIFDITNPCYIKDELVIYRVHENNISINFAANLKRCVLVFKNFKPNNLNQKIFKLLGIFFYSIRVFIKTKFI